MKILTNRADKDITVSFEGTDYFLPLEKSVSVEDKVAEYIHGQLPFVNIGEMPQNKNVKVDAIKKTKTPVYVGKQPPTTDMFTTRKADRNATVVPDGLPTSGKVDRDGIEWVGEGIEVDNDLTTRGFFH